MSHEPNDLEVRYENRVVGWLAGHDGKKSSHVIELEIHTATEHDTGFSESIIDARSFAVSRMKYSIGAHRLIDKVRGAREIAHCAAAYAEEYKDAMSDSTILHWRAVKLVDFEEYEWIFDHHCFVPVDGPLDFGLIKDAAPVGGKITDIDEGAALSDEGTLTAEKLKKAIGEIGKYPPLSP